MMVIHPVICLLQWLIMIFRNKGNAIDEKSEDIAK